MPDECPPKIVTTYIDARITDHQRQHEAEAQALRAATEAMAMRLATMNEFRSQMTQQASTFVSHAQLDATVAERNVRIAALQDKLEYLTAQVQRAAITAGVAAGILGALAGSALVIIFG